MTDTHPDKSASFGFLKISGMLASLPSMDAECAYGFMAGEFMAIAPIAHKDYEIIVAARKAESG